MAIPTNGIQLVRISGALFNQQLSSADYAEILAANKTAAELNAWANAAVAAEFKGKTTTDIATAVLANVGLSSVTGLTAWVAGQLNAGGGFAKAGETLLTLLNDYSNMSTADATYGASVATFNKKVDNSQKASQTAGTASGTYAAVSSVSAAEKAAADAAAAKVIADAAAVKAAADAAAAKVVADAAAAKVIADAAAAEKVKTDAADAAAAAAAKAIADATAADAAVTAAQTALTAATTKAALTDATALTAATTTANTASTTAAAAKATADAALVTANTTLSTLLATANPLAADVVTANANQIIAASKATAAATAATTAATAAATAKTASDAATADDAAVVTAQTAYTAALAASKVAAAAAVTAAATSKTAAAATATTADDTAATAAVTAAAASGAVVAKADADAAAAAAAKVISDAAAVKAAADAAAAKVIADAAAKATADALAIVNAPKAFTLTTSSNFGTSFTGSGGDDIFDAPLSAGAQTLTTGDQLTGGAGTDSLIATITGTVTPTLLSSIENITITNTAAAIFGMANATGTTSLTLQSGVGGATVTGIGKAVGVTLSDSGQDHTITYNDVTASTGDAATVTLSNITAGTQSVLGIENLSIVAAGTSNVLTALTATQATTINVSGSANVTLGTLGTAALTVNASTATGIVTMTTGASTVGQTITGGTGADVITMGGTVADSLNGGTGSDTIIITSTSLTAADTIAGGDGTDNLVLRTVAAATDVTVADDQFTLLSSVERLSGATAAQGNTTTSDFAVTANTFAKAAGIVRFSAASSGDSAFSVALGSAYNGTAVTYDFSSVDNAANFNATATGTTAVMTFQGDADGFSAGDSMTGGTSSGDTLIFNSAGTTGTIGATIAGIEKINVTATNGAVTFTTTDTQITDSSSTALVVDASAASGASTFTFAAATAHAITYTGSGQVDSVTSGIGSDNLSLAAGDDVAVYTSAGLTTSDTVAGGAGNDTLSISDAATVTDVKFTNVTGVETLALAAATNSVTLEALAKAAGIATVTGGTGADTIAVSATFTGPLRVTMSTGNDSVIVTGAAVLTAAVDETGLTAADVITGGTTTGDILRLSSVAAADTASFAGVTAVETYLVVGDLGAVGITTADINAALGTTLTIDGSSLASGSFALTVDAALETDAKIVVTGGAAGDSITLTTTGADSVSGGDGGDTFTVSNTGFTLLDTLAGGNGTDIISMSDASTVVDADFTNVTSVNTINATGGVFTSLTLGSLAQAAGVTSVTGNAGADTIVIGTGYTGTVRVTAGTGSDAISASGSAATLQVAVALSSIDAADVWTGGTGATDELRLSATGTGTAASMVGITGFEKITTTADAAMTITLADVNIASGVNMIVNAATLVTTNALTFSAENESNGTVSVTGGTGADIITGGAGADTINGGDGADIMDGGAGDDSITGGAGNDTVTTGSAGDVADGGLGTDTLTVSAIGSGAFVIDLSSTGDQLTTYNGAANAGIQSGFEIVNLSNVNGAVTGTSAAAGSTITGGAGADSLTGAAGNDSLSGGAGADVLVAGSGADTLVGGAGNDSYRIELLSGAVNDTVTEAASAGTDTLFVLGAAASATSRVVLNLTLAVNGGTGTDNSIDVLDATAITVAGALVTLGAVGGTVLGTDFSDSVQGAVGADSLVGGSGADILLGADGLDTISGGTGADYIDGGTGDDIDSLVGGTGDDSFLVADIGAVDIFMEAAGEGTLDTLLVTALSVVGINVNGTAAGPLNGANGLGFEQVALGAGATTFTGAQLSGLTINFTEQSAVTSNIVVTATSGGTTNLSALTFNASTFTNAAGAVVVGNAMVLSTGTDTLTINGADAASEILIGSSGIDIFSAGAGATTSDTIRGGGGADVIDLGALLGADSVAFEGTTATAGVTAAATLGVDAITNFAGGTTANVGDVLRFSETTFGALGTAGAGNLTGANIAVLAATNTAFNAGATDALGGASDFANTTAGLIIVGTNAATNTVALYYYNGLGASADTTVAAQVTAGNAVQIATIGVITAALAIGNFVDIA